jgi:hypothetical protein
VRALASLHTHPISCCNFGTAAMEAVWPAGRMERRSRKCWACLFSWLIDARLLEAAVERILIFAVFCDFHVLVQSPMIYRSSVSRHRRKSRMFGALFHILSPKRKSETSYFSRKRTRFRRIYNREDVRHPYFPSCRFFPCQDEKYSD